MPLPDREREVLTTIIEAYITTALPVGSRAVSRQSHLGLSPASIRNLMAAKAALAQAGTNIDVIVIDATQPGWVDSLRALPPTVSLVGGPMKFGLLLDAAHERGASHLATGHFARLEQTGDGPALYRGDDPSRDQSYFLSLVPRAALGQVVFPLARRRKVDNAAALAELGLAPPLPRESREVCFVPGDDYRAFLEQSGHPLSGPGPIVLPDGRRVGTHQGLWRHTIGQRKGLGVAYAEPLYVLAKDARANALRVGTKSELSATVCHTGPANLLTTPDTWPAQVGVQTCYRMEAVNGTPVIDIKPAEGNQPPRHA